MKQTIVVTLTVMVLGSAGLVYAAGRLRPLSPNILAPKLIAYGAPAKGNKTRVRFDAARTTLSARGIVLTGNAWMETPDLRLEADRIVMNSGKDGFDEIIATGKQVHIRLLQAEVSGSPVGAVSATCSRATYRSGEQKITLDGPVVLKAPEREKFLGGELKGDSATIDLDTEQGVHVTIDGTKGHVDILTPAKRNTPKTTDGKTTAEKPAATEQKDNAAGNQPSDKDKEPNNSQ